MTAFFVAFTTVFVAAPAMAAPVYEITARWADGTPAEVKAGELLTSTWRINVNDDAQAPSNEPVDNVNFSVTATNGLIASIPDVCLTTGVTPASSISADRKTLLCNVGTQAQGTAVVIDVPVTADGTSADEVSLAGQIGEATAAVSPVPIVTPFGMDIRWGSATSNLVRGAGYVDMDFQWTLSTLAGSDAGPNSISYDLTIAAANGSVTSVAPGACSSFTTGSAAGHPWSGGTHAADQTAPSVQTCSLVKTGATTYRLTLTGIDYSRTQLPRSDSAGNPLPATHEAVASGQILIRVQTTTNTGVSLTSSAPAYISVNGATAQDDAANNTASKTATFGSGWSGAWNRRYTGTGGSSWDDAYRVSPGSTVQQFMNGEPEVDTASNGTNGWCQVLDSRYVTYDSASADTYATVNGASQEADGFVLEYYVGGAAVVDPDSSAYDPQQFDCGSASGWTTTEPADKTTIKAIRTVYPSAAAKNFWRTGLTMQVVIKDDVQPGQDIWQFSNRYHRGGWEPAVGNAVTNTPDARYPFTSSKRDILRVVVATPSVLKSVDRATVRPGEIANYTLTYSANGGAGIPATVDGYQLVDTLPLGMTYVSASASPEPAVSTNPQGRQVLTWTLNGVPTNTNVPMTYQSVADPSVVPGQRLQNTVSASYGGHTSTQSAAVTVSTNGYTTIGKTADTPFIPNLGGDGVGEGSWTVTLRSFDPLPQAYTDTIDILPFNGDARGTEFAGDYVLTGIDAAPGATVYYTTANPSTVSDDPANASNGAAGTVTGNTVGWTTTFTPDATAVRVIGGILAPGGTQQFTVNIATDGVEGGDTLVNRAQARDGHTELVMRTSAPITIANYYSASLKKYVQDADGEWRDANTVEDYPTFKVGDTIRYRIVVENTGQGTLTGLEISDDKQPELGSFVIDSLAPGASEVHEYEIVADAASGDGVVNTACAAADVPEDSGVAPTINCDPAGFEVEGDPTHTKSIISAAPIGGGQWEIYYELEVTNNSTAATTYSLADQLRFSDQVTIQNAQITASPQGVTLADPAWDGRANLDVATGVALLGNDDAGYSSHTYTLRVLADAPLQFDPVGGDLPATDCAAEGEGTTTAFNNTSALTRANGDVEPDQACAELPSIDINKSVSAGPTPNGDGTWTVTYDVVATNDGAAAGVYDISDRMTADGDLEVVSGSVITAPAGVTPSATWTGLGAEGAAENVIASGVTLPAGGTHTYQVEVVIGLAEGTDGAPVITDCAAEPGENGGLSNTAEIEHNDLTDDASACITVGIVTVDKSVSSGPTPNGDGTWTIIYDIVATHVGAADADYDVTDRLHFGEGIEIVDHEVRSLDGIDVNSDWTGLGADDSDPENVVAEGVTLSVGESHTYQVEVTVQMDEATMDPTDLQCPPPGSGDAGGLGNSTTLTSNGITGQDEVCPTLPLIELDKQIVDGSPVENGDGTWTIAYDVTATNIGAAEGDYDLSDRLRYGAGIDVESAEITSAPDGVALNGGWTGQGAEGAGENVIATDVTLAAGATHTYRVVIIASMDRAVVTPGDLVCPAPGSGADGGFANTADLTHNGEPQDAEACVSPPLIEITKSLSGAVTPVDGQDGVYDATYELTVTNSGAGAGVYDLDDQLAPGEGITIVGVQAVTTDVVGGAALNEGFNGVDDLRIVTDQAIAGAAGAPVVHTYTVTVRYAADLAGIEVPSGDVCTAPDGSSLPGTLNNTATVGWNGLEGEDNECIIPGKPTLDKTIVSATPIGNGQWEVVYDLTVGNTGTEATTYDLDDELLFAPQVTVDSISVTGPSGIALNAGFDGDSDQRIATDVAIIGLDDDGYTPHVYTVTVIANVPLTFDPEVVGENGTGSPACTVPAGSNLVEQGLNNAATLTDETGGTIVDTDCAGLPSIDIVKAMDGDPVKGANGHWTVNYTITVDNDGAATGAYTVTDQLRYGAGIEVLSATVTSAPAGVTTETGWTGLGEKGANENVVASDVSLAAGGVHIYQVVVETRLDTATADGTTLVCPAPGSDARGGFANTAGLDHNDLTDEANACAIPEWPKDVPPPLAQTGGTIALGALGAALALLIAGGVLLHIRRRATAA